jgi:hypothetical protein
VTSRPATPSLKAWRQRNPDGGPPFDALWLAACWEQGALNAWQAGSGSVARSCLSQAAAVRKEAGL